MAIGDVRRNAVESLPRRKRRAEPAQTTDTYFQASQPSQQESTATRVVKGLFDFSGQALDFSVRQEAKKIELDKVTQQQRALQGLDPTEDATDAGVRAFQVVKMRDQVLETNSDLAQRIRENPDMDDEEYELATREAYAPLLEQYQEDPTLSGALSNRLQESQTQIHQIRSAARREHQDWQRQEAFKTSIEEYREAAGSTEELASMINEGQLYNEADALGITEPQFRTGLIQMAQMDASQGDGRILQAIENQGWASSDPRVQKAMETHRAWQARNSAVEIGTQWGEIQQGWKNRTASWEQTQEAIRRINDQFPGSITANQVASLRQQASATHARDAANNQALQGFWESQNSDNPIRLGSNPLIPDQQRDFIIQDTSDKIDTAARQAQATGEMSPEEAQAFAVREKIRFGREQGIEMPGVSSIITSLAGDAPKDWEGDGVPTSILPALRAIPMMNESDIDMYGDTETERNMMRNYQQFLESNEPSRGAWNRAYRSVVNASALAPEERSTLVDRTNEVIDKELDTGFFASFTRDEVPEGLRSRIRSDARRESLALIDTGGVSYEKAGEVGARRALDKYTILDSGSYVAWNREELMRASAFRGEDGRAYQLRGNDISPAFEKYFNDNREALALESYYGTELDIQNVTFETNAGGMITVYDDVGEPLTNGPINLQRITKDYVDAVSERRASSALGRQQSRRTGNVQFEAIAPDDDQVTEGAPQ